MRHDKLRKNSEKIKYFIIFIFFIICFGNLWLIEQIPKLNDDISFNTFLNSPEYETTQKKHKYSGIKIPGLDNIGRDLNLVFQSNKVKEMMVHAWSNYKKYAWGKNELILKNGTFADTGIFERCKFGATIIDSMDTLFIMGLMNEYHEGRTWIANEFTLDNCTTVISIFEFNIRIIGGFLSLFALTNDTLYKEKAVYVAERIIPCFENSTLGIPSQFIDFSDNDQCFFGMTYLADAGTFSLEFMYLSKITGNDTYVRLIERLNSGIKSNRKIDGLYPSLINTAFTQSMGTVSFGGGADSFYEYLLKAWILSGKQDIEAQNWFIKVIDPIMDNLVKTTADGDLFIGGQPPYSMDHLSCFGGGFFALAAKSGIYPDATSRLQEIGKKLTETCRKTYTMTKTGLGPENIMFLPKFLIMDPGYRLRPETVESYFYLWRTTHSIKYREWAWDVVLAIERYCKTPFGYSGIEDVNADLSQYDNVQQSYFMSETLKYLYLIFYDDTVISLEQYVFNTEAHPLPIFVGK